MKCRPNNVRVSAPTHLIPAVALALSLVSLPSFGLPHLVSNAKRKPGTKLLAGGKVSFG